MTYGPAIKAPGLDRRPRRGHPGKEQMGTGLSQKSSLAPRGPFRRRILSRNKEMIMFYKTPFEMLSDLL